MVDYLLTTYGTDVMADIAEEYRAGATEGEAIEAATGTPFADIRAAYFEQFGVTEPLPIEPVTLERSDVALPPQPDGGSGPLPPEGGSGDGQELAWWLIIVLVVVGLVFGVTVVLVARRRRPSAGGAA
jgi:hypothetical protein